MSSKDHAFTLGINLRVTHDMKAVVDQMAAKTYEGLRVLALKAALTA